MRVLQINGKPYRKVQRDEQLRSGDMFRSKRSHPYRNGFIPLHLWDTKYTPSRFPNYRFYRELDPLIAAMLKVRDKT